MSAQRAVDRKRLGAKKAMSQPPPESVRKNARSRSRRYDARKQEFLGSSLDASEVAGPEVLRQARLPLYSSLTPGALGQQPSNLLLQYGSFDVSCSH